MEWKRAKNIILAVLILTNLTLLLSIVGNYSQFDQEAKEIQQLSLSLLENQGHTVNPKALDGVPMVVYGYYQERDGGRESEIAQNALGGFTKKDHGGGIEEYTAEKGNLLFRNGGFFVCELYGVNTGEDLLKTASDTLKALKIYKGPLIMENNIGRAQQKIQGKYPIDGYDILAEQTTRGLKIQGKFYDTRRAQRVRSDWNIAKIFIELSQLIEEKSVIEQFELIYICENATSEDSLFVPVLKATLRDQVIYINGETGKQIRR